MQKPSKRGTSAGSFFALALALATTCLLYTPDAHAYLDAGTGSLILQVIAGLFLGFLLTVKLWWYKLVGALRRLFGAGNVTAE